MNKAARGFDARAVALEYVEEIEHFERSTRTKILHIDSIASTKHPQVWLLDHVGLTDTDRSLN
jgi:hypothetical protein